MASAAAGAQQTTPTTNQSTPDTVGPRELQNFRLPGTVTRPPDQPATNAPSTTTQTAPAAQPPAERPTPRQAQTTAATPRPTPAPRRTEAPAQSSAPTATAVTPPPASSTPAPSFTQPSAPLASSGLPQAAPAPAAVAPAAPTVPMFVWLLAGLFLGGGAAFLFFRRRERLAFAGVDDSVVEPQPFERAAAPTPAPSPPAALPPAPTQPAPQPPAPAAPAPVTPAASAGIVSTRLRPWIEIGLNPVRCTLDPERATVDFELELFNSGSAPARNLIATATAFNAGPNQDALIAAYFDQPPAGGHGVEFIGPLERTPVPLQMAIPREQLQPYELGGHQVFVPLLAITVTYEWSSGGGQTSASYLLGRDTGGDKLAPFRLEAGPRLFGQLGAKPLPQAVRR